MFTITSQTLTLVSNKIPATPVNNKTPATQETVMKVTSGASGNIELWIANAPQKNLNGIPAHVPALNQDRDSHRKDGLLGDVSCGPDGIP